MSPITAKLAGLRAATTTLKRGGLIAHHTATLPGVAAHPRSALAINRLCRFKQRQGPFLLLADSVKTAMQQIRFFSPRLRKLIKESWPGAVTIIVPAKPGLSKQCYNKSRMAIRVDASAQTRRLARACGGLLLSSSLNRKGGKPLEVSRKTCMRMHRFLNSRLPGLPGSGNASSILRVWRNDSTTIRS